jgi:hypothetical protein
MSPSLGLSQGIGPCGALRLFAVSDVARLYRVATSARKQDEEWV